MTDILPTRRQVAIASVAETDSRLTLFNSSMTVSKWSGDRRGSRTPRPKRLMGVGWGFSGPLIIYLRESRFLGDSEPFAQNHLACASPGKGGGRVASLLSVASVGSHRGLPPVGDRPPGWRAPTTPGIWLPRAAPSRPGGRALGCTRGVHAPTPAVGSPSSRSS